MCAFSAFYPEFRKCALLGVAGLLVGQCVQLLPCNEGTWSSGTEQRQERVQGSLEQCCLLLQPSCSSSMRQLPGVLFMADGLGPDQSLHTEAAPVHWADGVLPGGDQGERPCRVPAGEQAGSPSSNSMAMSQTSQGSRKVPPCGLELSRFSCVQWFQNT